MMHFHTQNAREDKKEKTNYKRGSGGKTFASKSESSPTKSQYLSRQTFKKTNPGKKHILMNLSTAHQTNRVNFLNSGN